MFYIHRFFQKRQKNLTNAESGIFKNVLIGSAYRFLRLKNWITNLWPTNETPGNQLGQDARKGH